MIEEHVFVVGIVIALIIIAIVLIDSGIE